MYYDRSVYPCAQLYHQKRLGNVVLVKIEVEEE
jgi:hypothetical protein